MDDLMRAAASSQGGDPQLQFYLDMAGVSPADVQQWQSQQRQQEQQAAAQAQTAPPENPYQALQYQFYGAQDTQRRQEEMLGQSMEAFEQGRQETSQAHQESQQRNESLMREGLATQQAEQEAVRQQNAEMMRQSQATLQHMFGLLRRGGEGSLAAFSSPMGQAMANTWQQGRWNPMQSGQYFQGMQGTPDPSGQYYGQMGNVLANTQFQAPDYSAWMDPESMRQSWYLPPQTTQTQTFPTAQSGVPQQQNQMRYDPNQFQMDWFQGLFGPQPPAQGSGYSFG
jgi:hypothetical protein